MKTACLGIERVSCRKLGKWHGQCRHVHSGMFIVNHVLSGSAAIGMFTVAILLAEIDREVDSSIGR